MLGFRWNNIFKFEIQSDEWYFINAKTEILRVHCIVVQEIHLRYITSKNFVKCNESLTLRLLRYILNHLYDLLCSQKLKGSEN